MTQQAKAQPKLTINMPRGSKLATYPELARLCGKKLDSTALKLLSGFTLIDGQRLRIEIDCQADVVWVMSQGEKAPDLRSIIHVTVDGTPTEKELQEVCNQFADAACAQGDTTVMSPAGITARVEERSSGPSLEIVRLHVSKS